jgi:molecular chaperone GrpE
MSDQRDPNSFLPDDASSRDSAPDQASSSFSSSQGTGDAAGTPGGEITDPLQVAREEVIRMKEAWMRTAADFDNFRKRTRKELDDARRSGREDLLRELLPVFDNIERGMQSAKQATDVKAVVDGLGMILKQFVETLGRGGISKVPTVGVPFDPAIHEAIQQVETSDQPPGTVVAEVQPGYMAGDRLARAAMVVVAKPKAAATSTN